MFCAKAILSDTDPAWPPQIHFPATATNCSVRPTSTFTSSCETTWGTNPQCSLNTSTRRSSTRTETVFSGSKTAEEPQDPFPFAFLHLTSPSLLVPHADSRIDGSALWVKCNLRQKAGINTFSYFFSSTKLIFCYAYKAKLSALVPSSLYSGCSFKLEVWFMSLTIWFCNYAELLMQPDLSLNVGL